MQIGADGIAVRLEEGISAGGPVVEDEQGEIGVVSEEDGDPQPRDQPDPEPVQFVHGCQESVEAESKSEVKLIEDP